MTPDPPPALSVRPDRLEDLAGWAVAGGGLMLPFIAIGGTSVEHVSPLIPFDLCIAVGALLSARSVIREPRRYLLHPAIQLAAMLSAAGCLSALAHADPSVATIAKQLAPAITVLTVASVCRRTALRERVLRAVVLGGAICLTVTSIGFTTDLAGLTELHLEVVHPHPVFDRLPRLAGTLGGSPQRLGQYLVTWLALVPLALHGRMQRLRIPLLIAGAATLFMTMSFAWTGGLALFSSALRGRARIGWLLATVVAAAVASIPMHLGAEHPQTRGPCASLDVHHHVARYEGNRTCTILSENGRWIPAYREAKRASVEAIRAYPWFGTGYAGFDAHTVASFRNRYGGAGPHYRQPHGIYHGLPAKYGIGGWLVLLAGVWLAWRLRRTEWTTLHAGLLGLAVIGLHIDVDRLRHGWLLLGVFAAVVPPGVAPTPREPREKPA